MSSSRFWKFAFPWGHSDFLQKRVFGKPAVLKRRKVRYPHTDINARRADLPFNCENVCESCRTSLSTHCFSMEETSSRLRAVEAYKITTLPPYNALPYRLSKTISSILLGLNHLHHDRLQIVRHPQPFWPRGHRNWRQQRSRRVSVSCRKGLFLQTWVCD